MRERSSSIIIGLIFIVLGIGFFIDQLGIDLGFNIGSLWPILIILVGLFLLFKRSFFAGFIITGLGVAFLVSQLTTINAFAIFWPLIIIAVGLSILFRPKHENWSSGAHNVNSDRINESILFWGADWRITSKNFKGGKIDTVFGGFKLDLRDAEITPEGATLSVNSVFGGGEIIIPENMRVEARGDGIFGGWSNKFRSSTDSTKPLLKINGSAIFGGIDIKN